MIHGMWCTGDHWARVKSIMEPRGYDCHAVTLPAHEPGPGQMTQVGAKSLRDYLVFLEDYVSRQCFSQPPIIIGHSMGGLLAQQLAAKIRPLALVLMTPAPPAGIFAFSWSNLVAFARALFRWAFWRKPHKPGFRRAEISAFNHVPAEQHRRMYDGLVYESGRALFEIGMWQLDFSHASRVDVAAVRCPVYVVSSGKDRLTPTPLVRKVAALYPQAAQRHYPERGHWVIEDEDTEEMVTSICGWLRPLEKRLERTGKAA
ncbi:MAG: alpha/beta hydrolase [Stenotrophobium sp.]